MYDEAELDLVIRNGTIIDGSGGPAIEADIAIKGDRIMAIGAVQAKGRAEIDAAGLLVVPGFIDAHTHYDGQAIWSDRITPSSAHGVTTVVIGNCGVGFAPCREADRDVLMNIMEGVEDIPEIVIADGLTWEWETFPEYLDAIERRPHDIDVAALVPHSALRVYAMGQRGADRQPATAADLAVIETLVRDAMRAGAVGVSTSDYFGHRRGDGDHVPTFEATEQEYTAIAQAIASSGRGLMQMAVNVVTEDEDAAVEAMAMMKRIAAASDIQITFSLTQPNNVSDRCHRILQIIDADRPREGSPLRPQVFPRPVGMLIGYDLTANPFSFCPSYQALAALPLNERIAELRKPGMRARILGEAPAEATMPLHKLLRDFHLMFVLGDPPNYEPALEDSIAARAARAGISPAELAYDILLADDGHAMLYIAIFNYADGNLDFVIDMLEHPDVVLALGDGGAHYGLICDASYPTFLLAHLTRDRKGRKVPLAQAVRHLTSQPAALLGLRDRGLLKPGLKADLNIIDYAALTLNPLVVRYDLPSGGRRLDQTARGYKATIVSGRTIARDGEPTGERPGRLVRASSPAGHGAAFA